jgi:hypothetical protein
VFDGTPVGEGTVWIDLVGGSEAQPLLQVLKPLCTGLTLEMLQDLLTPDDRPEGASYGDGEIRLASTFSVKPESLDGKEERGVAQRAGALTFQPVEMLASKDWLLTCWHNNRTFLGAEKINEGQPASVEALIPELTQAWLDRDGCAGDLGLMIMHKLALGYRAAAWQLNSWHQDWELSLYMEDELDNPEELPHLWGMMAVLRDWLTPLNKPGLRSDPTQAWLPGCDHSQVIELDDRIDKTLDQLRHLATEMRSSFSVLHGQQAEESRQRKEATQHRIELVAAIFLVPTLVVGFYGANTWIPGQGRHWGFYVMLVVLFALTLGAIGMVLRWRRLERAEVKRLAQERDRDRAALLRALSQ